MNASGVREVGIVEELWRYPVSALGGERLETATLEERGLVGDRAWAVVDASTGEAAAPERAKRWRPATHVEARFTSQGPEIAVPGGSWLACTDEQTGPALSAHLGFPVELRQEARVGEESHAGTVAPRYERAAVHVLTTSALGALQALCPESSKIDVRRFRPNIVVATDAAADGAVELDWVDRRMRIGDATVRVLGPCGRCAFPTLAQRELPHDAGVLRAIAKSFGGSFGVLCEVVTSGTLVTGERVLLA